MTGFYKLTNTYWLNLKIDWDITLVNLQIDWNFHTICKLTDSNTHFTNCLKFSDNLQIAWCDKLTLTYICIPLYINHLISLNKFVCFCLHLQTCWFDLNEVFQMQICYWVRRVSRQGRAFSQPKSFSVGYYCFFLVYKRFFNGLLLLLPSL